MTRSCTPRQFRATLQGYFLPVSLVGLAGYLYVGLWDAAVTQYFLWSLPGVALAIVLGRVIIAASTAIGSSVSSTWGSR